MKRRLILVTVFLIAGISIVIAWKILRTGEPAADFSVTEFHEEYKDWKAANQRYVGQPLAIRGEVEWVDYSWLTPHGWKSLSLRDKGTREAGVICHFSPAKVDQAERLVPGQVVVVRGVCIGEFGGYPILSECVIEWASYRLLDIGKILEIPEWP